MNDSEAEAVHSLNGSTGTPPASAQLDLGFAERRQSVLAGVEEVALPASIVKRDGRVVPFDPMRIERAVSRCFAALGRTPYTPIPELALRVVNIMSARPGQPSVEIVQDAVELTLQAAGEFEAAKAYILYRAEHAKQRQERPIPEEVREAFAQADRYFPTPIQKFQFFDKYSRFDYDKGRRETWIETVDRAVAFLHELVQTNTGADLGSEVYEHLRRMILEMKSMPSMRLLAMAGPPARRDATAIYNCSYLPVESIDSFAEALLISMAGCGVGFSVESRYVENFPRVQRQRGLAPLRHTIEDSAQGWGAAVRLGMQTWFEGGDVDFNYDPIRPAGAPLRTKGGRASGPGPLKTMLEFARARILARQGMHLRPIDAHDIMCMVGNAAVSGGVRRCLPAGTRVHTSRGALPIEEVREGDLVMTAYGYKPVTGWLDQGVQDVVEIVTESGTLFRCTPHHRVAVLTDVWGGHTFKYARDLTPEDRLLFIARPTDGTRQSLFPLPGLRDADHSGSQVQQPTLDADTAWFLGKFFADGYVHIVPHDARGKLGNTQFSVACGTKETAQIERVTVWMKRHGLQVQRLQGNGNWITLRSSNRRIARWVAGYKTPKSPLCIPEAIWRSTIAVRAAFLAGLMDGDGCFVDRPVTVVATVYEEFGREVVKLLATLGIIAEIRCRRPATHDGWKAQWIVTIKDALALEHAQELIGSRTCGSWVSRVGKQAGYTVPGWMVHRDVPHPKWASVWAGSRDVWPSSRDRHMNSATLTTLIDATHYVPVAVREVRPAGAAHTYDIEVRDGSMFVAEGYLVHNTAMLSLFDFDDLEMRLCKSGDFERDNSQRWNANNSAVWPERGLDQIQVMEQVLDMVKSQRGEPGIFNRKATLDLIPERRKAFGYQEYGTNPCVTGDTWVAVADGRGRARMADLVTEGKDVDVYSVSNGQLVVRTMRNPRKTGSAVPIVRVRFSDGTSVRVTRNHKFVLTDGSQVEAIALRPNDALTSMSCYSYQKRGLPKTEKVDYDAAGSYRMLQFGRELHKSEHRYLFQHHFGRELVGIDEHLHHRDFDGRNNRLDNLLLLDASEHAAYHRERMVGPNNPVHKMTDAWRSNISRAVRGLDNGRAKDLTNEDLESQLEDFVRALGCMPTLPQYLEFARRKNLPQSFAAHRREYFGGDVLHALRTVAQRLGSLPRFEAEARKVTDLPVLFRDGRTWVVKACEGCGARLEVHLSLRESAFCRSCGQKEYYRRQGSRARVEALREGHRRKHDRVREEQTRTYNDLLFRLGRHPSKQEWQDECRQAGVSPEISRASSPFRYWRQLRDAALVANHRVVSIEDDGAEDVFTGTVDDTHTYFAIGTERHDRRGRIEMSYVLNAQCGEIVLRKYGFCNLSIAVARSDDTFESLKEKVQAATIIGTIQSLATHFPDLRPIWKQNCEEERLLGVDITGQMDCPTVHDPAVMRALREAATETNRSFAEKLGINRAAAITTVKPSGNSSQLLNCSSGLHARWAPYYERNVRVAATSPIFKVLRDAGVPMDPENGQTRDDAHTWVIHFPMKSPEGAITRQDRGAIEQCNYWLHNKLNWTDHNPSVTITYKADEVVDLTKWIWKHRDLIGGMAFLPTFDAQYDQLPYIEISKEEYERRVAEFPAIDFSKLWRYESTDLTLAAQELACLAGQCEAEV